MKKYEAPIVELTKFDVEDVITASAGTIDVTTLDEVGITTALADLEAGMTLGSNDLDGVFSW